MNVLTIMLISLFATTNVKDVVSEFHKLQSEKTEVEFIERYSDSKEPDILGYVYAIEMKQAEYCFNPISKLDIFNRNKKKLDNLILKYPNNIHLRYIRLVIQEQTPSILGYNGFIEEDQNILRTKLKEEDSLDYLNFYIKKHTSL